jgi:hypothetical protein
MEEKVEKREQSGVKGGIPIPRRSVHYDWDALEQIGDSFFIPGGVAKLVRAAASAHGKARGKRYATRQRRDGAEWGYVGVDGIAVWLVG